VRAACVCGAGWGLDEPQPISRPVAPIAASSKGKRVSARFLRKLKGKPSKIAQNNTEPPRFHGAARLWFAALAVAVMVTVEVPVPPEVRVTGVAVAVTFAGVPSVEVTAMAKDTVPA